MRTSSLSFITALLVLSSATVANAQTSTVTLNLSLGSRNVQVIALQQILNRDPDTRIATAGPGSLGNETIYFGALTKAAVTRFQEKYAAEVLMPVRLSQGNGYVGSYTRAKLNALSAAPTNTVSVNPPIVPPVVIPPTATIPVPVTVSSTPAPILGTAHQNPNQKNLDVFMAALDKAAVKGGLSSTARDIIRAVAIKSAATTTDLRAAFLKTVQKSSPQAQNTSFGGRILAIAEQLFGKAFLPEHARAATGVPFGGALLFAEMICNEETQWLIEVEPLPPSYAAILMYTPESQAFASYNIPFTTWLLGEYEPGAGVCIIGQCPYCTDFPTEGLISPMVGSSPL